MIHLTGLNMKHDGKKCTNVIKRTVHMLDCVPLCFVQTKESKQISIRIIILFDHVQI